MRKRRPALNPDQLGFSFEAPSFAPSECGLAGLDRFVAAGVSQAMQQDGRSRPELAGAMTSLLGEDISRFMLDAYASEAREQHNIPASRFFGLIAVTGGYDVLDACTRRIGASVLIGEEINTARLGHIDRQIATLQAEKKRIQTVARPIERGACA